MTTKPSPRIELSLILLAAAIGLGIFALFQAPGLFGDEAPGSSEYAANRQRIEQMTQSERDRIKRRAEKFAELSESRRNQLRNLHAELQTAPDAKGLKQVLKRYNTWLASLPVHERDDLRKELSKAKTPQEQREVVARTKRKKDVERLLQSVPPHERAAYYRERDPEKKAEILARIRETSGTSRSWGPRLSPDDLDKVLNVIVGQMKPLASQVAEWDKLEPQKRRLRIMTAALKEHAERRRQREPGQPAQGLLSDFNLKKPIEEGIADAELRDRLLEQNRFRRRRFFSNFRILFLIKNSIDAERRQEAGNPTERQLGDFFEKLSEKKLEELTQHGSEKMKTLKQWYFISGGDNGEDYRAFATEFYGMLRSGFRGKGGGNRSGGKPSRRGRSGEPRRK